MYGKVGRSVHLFGSDWNISTTIGWDVIHGPNGPFFLMPTAGESF